MIGKVLKRGDPEVMTFMPKFTVVPRFPFFPFLVSITITPLAARAPQIEAAAASFKKVIDSTSFGFKFFISKSVGNPSTTNNGRLIASVKLLLPRIFIEIFVCSSNCPSVRFEPYKKVISEFLTST